MKDNRFERLYGYVFRSLAKSILEEFVKKNTEESLTIGILQYKPFDESFYYTSSINNCLLLPDEIKELDFPTKKYHLWNYELMKYLGIYLSQSRANHWIHELFEENLIVSKQNASTYSITYDGYDSFISSWEKWYNDNIHGVKVDTISNFEKIESKRLLNQIFYFGSYLLTITRQPAFSNREKNRTYAEEIYLCISNPQLLGDNDYFDKRTGFMTKGKNIVWTSQQRTLMYKAQLIQVLEVCFRWPFGIREKIIVLKDLIERSRTISSSTKHEHILNATAVPLSYRGEFLGICYLSQPSNNKDGINIADKAEDLKKIVDESKIPGMLYRSRYATARLALQKINEDSFKDETIHRVFNLSHIYSSAPIAVLIDEHDKLFIRSRSETESIRKMETKQSVKSGSMLLNFLEKEIDGFSINSTPKQLFNWFDVCPPLTPEKWDKESDAYKAINVFNRKFFEFLNPLIHALPDQYKITSLVYLKVESNDGFYSLIFFNSNFTLLYDADITVRKKQSYALEMHNNIIQLIETEQIHRLIFFQNRLFQDDLRKGVMHYIKGFLKFRVLPFLKEPVSEKNRIHLISNCNQLANRLKDWLSTYDLESKKQIITINELKIIWKNTTDQYPQHYIDFLFNVADILIERNAKINSNEHGLRIVFSEIIENAIKQYYLLNIPRGTITLSIVNDSQNYVLTIKNSDTWISTKYLETAGLEMGLGDSGSTGLGFSRCEDILKKIGALKIGRRHFKIDNIDEPKAFYVQFKFKGE